MRLTMLLTAIQDAGPKSGKTFVPRMDAKKTLAAVHWLLKHHGDEFAEPKLAQDAWSAWAASHPSVVDDVANKPTWEWPGPCSDYRNNLPPGLAEKSITFVRCRLELNPHTGLAGFSLSHATLLLCRVRPFNSGMQLPETNWGGSSSSRTWMSWADFRSIHQSQRAHLSGSSTTKLKVR